MAKWRKVELPGKFGGAKVTAWIRIRSNWLGIAILVVVILVLVVVAKMALFY